MSWLAELLKMLVVLSELVRADSNTPPVGACSPVHLKSLIGRRHNVQGGLEGDGMDLIFF